MLRGEGELALMLKLDYNAAHRFVEGNPDAFWDGWTMVIFKGTPSGYTRPDGMLRNGQWGIAKRVEPNDQGRYVFRA